MFEHPHRGLKTRLDGTESPSSCMLMLHCTSTMTFMTLDALFGIISAILSHHDAESARLSVQDWLLRLSEDDLVTLRCRRRYLRV